MLDDHDTFWLVALVGYTVASNEAVSPTFISSEDGDTETPVTETVVDVTVTLQVDVLPPSTVVTVIVALPAFLPVTTPSEETVATLVLLDDQVRDLFVASEGYTFAVSVEESPTLNVKDVLVRPTLVTGISFFDTVTVHVAVLPPSAVLTVIVDVPAFFAVTKPSDDTLAMVEELEDQFIVLFEALEGETVALN